MKSEDIEPSELIWEIASEHRKLKNHIKYLQF